MSFATIVKELDAEIARLQPAQGVLSGLAGVASSSLHPVCGQAETESGSRNVSSEPKPDTALRSTKETLDSPKEDCKGDHGSDKSA
jgi:hypothetical protein